MADASKDAEIAAAAAVFAKDEGVWDTDSEIRFAPDAPVAKQKGVYTNRRIAGGRWLIVDYAADSGFQGHGVYGWDAARKTYIGTWVDSMMGTIARSEGTWDAATRTMTWNTEAAIGDRTIRYREIVQTRPDGTNLYQTLMPGLDGASFEMIRIVSTRRP